MKQQIQKRQRNTTTHCSTLEVDDGIEAQDSQSGRTASPCLYRERESDGRPVPDRGSGQTFGLSERDLREGKPRDLWPSRRSCAEHPDRRRDTLLPQERHLRPEPLVDGRAAH